MRALVSSQLNFETSSTDDDFSTWDSNSFLLSLYKWIEKNQKLWYLNMMRKLLTDRWLFLTQSMSYGQYCFNCTVWKLLWEFVQGNSNYALDSHLENQPFFIMNKCRYKCLHVKSIKEASSRGSHSYLSTPLLFIL